MIRSMRRERERKVKGKWGGGKEETGIKSVERGRRRYKLWAVSVCVCTHLYSSLLMSSSGLMKV